MYRVIYMKSEPTYLIHGKRSKEKWNKIMKPEEELVIVDEE